MRAQGLSEGAARRLRTDGYHRVAGHISAREHDAMLCSARALDGFRLAALDGDIGHAREVHFDDRHWGIRHVVADTGGLLTAHKVLISPHAIRGIDLAHRKIDVALTKEQVRDAPGLEADGPWSRRHEAPYYDYYGYPYYWFGAGVWGLESFPLAGESLNRDAAAAEAQAEAAAPEVVDSHLRGSSDVIGYAAAAADGEIGQVDDLLFDERSWQITLLAIGALGAASDRRVLVPPRTLVEVDWARRRLRFGVARDLVRRSPPYVPGTALSDAEELAVQRHYAGWP
jgi:hypothetical protein